MPTTRFLRRALCATTALALALPLGTRPAGAQTVETGTPPARVGQIAGLVGDVSFNGAGSNGAWVAAQDNYPLITGDSLYTQAGAEAAIALDSSRLVIAPLTELQVTSLDDESFTATQADGEMLLKLSALAPGQSFAIDTPGGTVTMAASGAYDIIAGPTTTVSVIAGQATAGGAVLGSGQAVTLTGGQAQATAFREDGFVRHALGELSPPPPPYVPQVVDQMTGIDELTSYGSWDQDPDYGAVWYPAVDAGWAPYREGSWAYVAPWGWTWVEAEPWGFAPFHYGRWIDRDGRWGWVPAADRGAAAGYTPVYAPALVTFFGLAAGAALTADIIRGGRVGWVPLAPGEAYRPPYHASAGYIQRLNRIDAPRGGFDGSMPIDHYANRGGATYVPAAAMAHGERIGRAGGGPVPAGELSRARPAAGAIDQAVRPAIAPRAAAAPRPEPARPVADRPAIEGARPEAARPDVPREAPRPAAPSFAARRDEVVPRPEVSRPEAAPEMPRVETPRPEMPRVETPQEQSPRLEAPPAERIESPRPPAPRVENATPFPRAEAPRIEAPRPAPRAEAPRPPPPANMPHPPG
jgi:hypothetical protein